MTRPAPAWPYPTVPVDGSASIDEEGENQTCECGNDSQTSSWCHADNLGRLTWGSEGSFDPSEFAVCPVCGRIYSNATLFEALEVAAVARYDTSSPTFMSALSQYNPDAYRDHR